MGAVVGRECFGRGGLQTVLQLRAVWRCGVMAVSSARTGLGWAGLGWAGLRGQKSDPSEDQHGNDWA